ncbi:MAG: serine/threonine-protein kinase [Polyangiaceae bacterium]
MARVIGQVVAGRYSIVRELGRGGMGTVFEAEHTSTGRRVALKRMDEALARRADVVARFELEARAAGRLDSKHIAQVLDFGRDDGSPFLVMELLRGRDLDAWLADVGCLPPAIAASLVAQACAGLAKAHEAGIIHRDLKPANLFLTVDDDDAITVKILDFGIAKILDAAAESEEASTSLTRTGSVLGSPRYMSPEQARAKKSLDARADIWSLGIVLYEAVTGETPHQSATTLGDLIVAISTERVPDLTELLPSLDRELAAVARRALAIDPSKRFASSAEMLAALRPHATPNLAVRVSDLRTPAGGVPSRKAKPTHGPAIDGLSGAFDALPSDPGAEHPASEQGTLAATRASNRGAATTKATLQSQTDPTSISGEMSPALTPRSTSELAGGSAGPAQLPSGTQSGHVTESSPGLAPKRSHGRALALAALVGLAVLATVAFAYSRSGSKDGSRTFETSTRGAPTVEDVASATSVRTGPQVAPTPAPMPSTVAQSERPVIPDSMNSVQPKASASSIPTTRTTSTVPPKPTTSPTPTSSSHVPSDPARQM